MDGELEPSGSSALPNIAQGLRYFAAMADVWSLTEGDRVIALGAPDAATYKAWLHGAIVEGPLLLPKKTVDRLGALIWIYDMRGADCGPRLRDWLATDWDWTVNNFVDEARKQTPEKRPGS